MSVTLRHPTRHMHPRQREALRGIPLRHVRAIVGRAHLQQNISGSGTLSGWLHSVVSEYRSLTAHRGADDAAHELEKRSRGDNIAAMRTCCSTCRQDAARLEAKDNR